MTSGPARAVRIHLHAVTRFVNGMNSVLLSRAPRAPYFVKGFFLSAILVAEGVTRETASATVARPALAHR